MLMTAVGDPGTVDWFARALGLMGFAVAAGSLAWQIVVHHQQGQRLTVSIAVVGVVGSAEVAALPSAWPKTPELLGDAWDEVRLRITVRNVGGVPIFIAQVGVDIGDGQVMSHQVKGVNPHLPLRVEPGEALVWLESYDGLVSGLMHKAMVGRTLRGRVELSNGDVLLTDDGVVVPRPPRV